MPLACCCVKVRQGNAMMRIVQRERGGCAHPIHKGSAARAPPHKHRGTQKRCWVGWLERGPAAQREGGIASHTCSSSSCWQPSQPLWSNTRHIL